MKKQPRKTKKPNAQVINFLLVKDLLETGLPIAQAVILSLLEDKNEDFRNSVWFTRYPI